MLSCFNNTSLRLHIPPSIMTLVKTNISLAIYLSLLMQGQVPWLGVSPVSVLLTPSLFPSLTTRVVESLTCFTHTQAFLKY